MTHCTNDLSIDARTGQPWWAVLLACCAAGLAFVLAFPPYGLWPLILLTPLGLMWAVREARSGFVLVAIVFATQFATWMWLQQWVRHVTDLGYPALCVALSCYTILFACIARRWCRSTIAARIPMAISLPILWTAVEYFRGDVLFNGYPWYLVAHPAIDAPYIPQVADLFGAYVVSFLGAMTAGAMLDWLTPKKAISVRPRVIGSIVTVAFVTLAGAYGVVRTHSVDLPTGPNILAIQTNLPQDNKVGWTLERQVLDLEDFIDQTRRAHREAVREGQVDLIIWPETMLPGRGLEPDTLRVLQLARFRIEEQVIPADFAATAIAGLHEELGVPLLIGSASFMGFRLNAQGFGEWDAHFNSAYLVSGQLPYQRYDKVFLTPFGETMPYISAWPWLEQLFLRLGARGMSFQLDRGNEIRLIEVPVEAEQSDSVVVGTPICFEDTVASVVRAMVWQDGVKRADFIVNLSNDGWFGEHDAGRSQHLQIARYRAIENRIFLVRAANTGRTVAIDSDGKLVAEAGDGRSPFTRETGELLVQTKIDPRWTLFGRIGNTFGAVTLLLTIGWLVHSWVAARRKEGSTG